MKEELRMFFVVLLITLKTLMVGTVGAIFFGVAWKGHPWVLIPLGGLLLIDYAILRYGFPPHSMFPFFSFFLNLLCVSIAAAQVAKNWPR